MNLFSGHTITLNEFYSNLPSLLNSYQSKINLLSATYCGHCSYEKLYKTSQIIAISSESCIDSVVNLNALKCIEENTNVIVEVVVDKEFIKNTFQSNSTPYILGYSEDNTLLWTWERAPKTVISVENSRDQKLVIVEKKKYRNGFYIKDTLEEIVSLL